MTDSAVAWPAFRAETQLPRSQRPRRRRNSRNSDEKSQFCLPIRSDSLSQSHDLDRFSRLPDKVVLLILDLLAQGSTRDICSVSLVSRKYHGLAEGILYRKILFGSHEHHLVFGESLRRRPRRGSTIRDFKLEYPKSDLSHLVLSHSLNGTNYMRNGIDHLASTLSAMSNLETLDVAAPAHLLQGIGALFNGPFDLACLKTCSLFFQFPDDAYWDLRESIHIFTHPTLETLSIKRAKLDDKGFDLIERPHSTALKILRLIECDVNCDSLADLLEFPECLKEFYMDHTAEPVPELEEDCDDFYEHVMALKDQAESVESITINFPSLGGRKVVRLREFQAVETLRVNFDTQLFGKTGRKPRLNSVGLPPRLKTLEFFNPIGADETVTELFTIMINDIDFMARELKTLLLVEGPNGVPEQILEACKGKRFDLELRRLDT